MKQLVDRLRGHYRIPITDGLGAVGGGEEPDNPSEFVRQFETAPIQHEAAAAISELTTKGDALLEALRRYGFPVSDAAVRALVDGGSNEAQAVHVAAIQFRAALNWRGTAA